METTSKVDEKPLLANDQRHLDTSHVIRFHHPVHELGAGDVCPQVDSLVPASETNRKIAGELGAIFSDPGFEAVAAEHLGAAVRIPTESYDGMDAPGKDPRWDVFYNFSSHLLKTYPRVHSTLVQTRINTHALFYHWPGSDSSLKPILLNAHQDVVPVDPKTVSSWIHPPYSGYYDGEWVWGRGASDDKTGVIGIMVALEKLIERGFKPKRGILIGLGIDEETSGKYGARAIANYIVEHFGKHNVAALVDEGGGIRMFDDVSVAEVDVAEKGYFDVRVEVATPGGHSSVPPEHTSIGILASLLVTIEATPDQPKLLRSSPVYSMLQCFAAHVPSIPPSFRSAVLASACTPGSSRRAQRKCDKALKEVEEQLFNAQSDFNRGIEFEAKWYRSLLSTTQAVDIIQGGVKSNALPDSISEVQDVIAARVLPIAEKYNLTLRSFTSTHNLTTGSLGTITLSDAWGTALTPAPVTPTEGKDAGAYRLLSRVIRKTRGDKKTAVSPSIMTSNTDTRYYWDVTPNIFRYSDLLDKDVYNGAHTINEGKLFNLYSH